MAKNGFLSGPPSRGLICHVHDQRSHVVRVADPERQATEWIVLWDLGRGAREEKGGKRQCYFWGVRIEREGARKLPHSLAEASA